jgi:hypothetical protein
MLIGLTPGADITDRKPSQYKPNGSHGQQHEEWLLRCNIAKLLQPATSGIKRFAISPFYGPGGLVTFALSLGWGIPGNLADGILDLADGLLYSPFNAVFINHDSSLIFSTLPKSHNSLARFLVSGDVAGSACSP